MKYMGSKRSMLLNGLGEAIAESVPKHRRFVDLFTGSGAVAWHVAQRYDIETVATDIQNFCVALAGGVLERTGLPSESDIQSWIVTSRIMAEQSPLFKEAVQIQAQIDSGEIQTVAERAREYCRLPGGPIFNAYGGYYYSPLQALKIDALRASLVSAGSAYSLALAALIWVASRCAASPGHTAQPFKPNETAGKYLREAWRRDVDSSLQSAIVAISPQFSKRMGTVVRSDANEMANSLKDGDLAFLDPPYSGVHYSRFYHVLETLTLFRHVEVFGSGRYPPKIDRPQSDYSLQAVSRLALRNLLQQLSRAGSSAIITFPAGKASNGLTGSVVKETADEYFVIKSEKVSGRFSTLGGNLRNREARQVAEELILTLSPRG